MGAKWSASSKQAEHLARLQTAKLQTAEFNKSAKTGRRMQMRARRQPGKLARWLGGSRDAAQARVRERLDLAGHERARARESAKGNRPAEQPHQARVASSLHADPPGHHFHLRPLGATLPISLSVCSGLTRVSKPSWFLGEA